VSGTYFVQTFGCQMNVHDSDRMEEVLGAHGWLRADDAQTADVVILNTCSVREKAEQKLRSEVGRLAILKRDRPELLIAVAGCVAQQEGEKLLSHIPALDLSSDPTTSPSSPPSSKRSAQALRRSPARSSISRRPSSCRRGPGPAARP
jgi:tRNA-2-methylthio-N6-dimethylallyladenosine synthase